MVACPPVDLLDPWFYAKDPYPAYRRLRDEDPVHWSEAAKLWALVRYEDVHWALRNPELLISGQGTRPKSPAFEAIIDQDDPRHAEVRRLLHDLLAPSQVAKRESRAREVAVRLANTLAHRGRFDFASDFARVLPAVLTAELLGFPAEDAPKIERWCRGLAATKGGGQNDAPDAVAAWTEFNEYRAGFADERKRCPVHDVLSALLNGRIDGRALPESEQVAQLQFLAVASIESTSAALAGGLEALLARPDQLERVLADRAAVPAAVEEILRWTSPVVLQRRTAAKEFELRGKKIAAGDEVLVIFDSANRDERVFSEPDVFDAARDPNPHLAFGYGAHFCLGAHLARLELRILLEEVLPRLPKMRLAPGFRPERAPAGSFRGFPTLQVECA
jgi:cytochrome P450 family 142 subfamily A polypeptide 1